MLSHRQAQICSFRPHVLGARADEHGCSKDKEEERVWLCGEATLSVTWMKDTEGTGHGEGNHLEPTKWKKVPWNP